MKILYLSRDYPTTNFMDKSLNINDNYVALPVTWTWEKYERIEHNTFWLYHKYDILQNRLSRDEELIMDKESILEGAQDLYYECKDDDVLTVVINEATKDSIDFFCEFLRICKGKKFHIIYFYFGERRFSYKEKNTDKYNPFESVDISTNKIVSLYLFDIDDIIDSVVYNKNSLKTNSYLAIAPYFENVDSEYSHSSYDERKIGHRIQDLVFEVMKSLFEEIKCLDADYNIYFGQYVLSAKYHYYNRYKNLYSSSEHSQYHNIRKSMYNRNQNMDFLFFIMANANKNYSELYPPHNTDRLRS